MGFTDLCCSGTGQDPDLRRWAELNINDTYSAVATAIGQISRAAQKAGESWISGGNLDTPSSIGSTDDSGRRSQSLHEDGTLGLDQGLLQ